MKKIAYTLIAFSCLLGTVAKADFDHHLLDVVLKEHVKSGMVDYAALKSDDRLDQYLENLAGADLSELKTDNEKMAFYINAYNAYTLKLVTSAYPTTSIRLIDALGSTVDSVDKAQPWKIEFAQIAGETYSLDYIEHEILRKDFQDGRIHFAIVCAAISCPILRSEAFVADRLDAQLESQGKWFFLWKNHFDVAKKEANLSKILEWFAGDFGDSPEEVLAFAIPYVKPQIAEALKGKTQDWKITYATYDWKLNTQ